MSKFQELYRKKLEQTAPPTEEPKQDLLLTFLKLLGGAILIFTFLSGVIFTLIPLLRNMALHMQTHIVEPIQRWMAAEPTTGHSLMFLLYATISVVIIYIMREKIQILFLWILSLFERAVEDTKHKVEVRKNQKLVEKPFGDTTLSPSTRISLTPTAIEPAKTDEPLF